MAQLSDAALVLTPVIRSAVESVGADLEEIVVRSAGRRFLLVVTVDADGGVDLDTVAAVSHAISSALDEDEALTTSAFGQAAYVLEVSSPGVDRPLTTPTHWRRAKGRLVEIVLAESTTTGRVASSDDTTVTLTTDKGDLTLDLALVKRATMVVEFKALGADDDTAGADLDEPDEDHDDSNDVRSEEV